MKDFEQRRDQPDLENVIADESSVLALCFVGDQPVKSAAASKMAKPTPAARPIDLTTSSPSMAEAAAGLTFACSVIAIHY